jgi:type IV secretion system protein TrbB
MLQSSQVGSALAPNGADEFAQRQLRKLRADLGPIVLEALEDPKTIDVILNEDGRLWLNRFGQPTRSIGRMDPVQADAVLRTVASILRTTVTADSPLLEGHLPGGERFMGYLPPVVRAPTFTVRKPAGSVFTLEQYAAAGIMTRGQMEALVQAVKDHRNFLVSGATTTGKTTLLNALLAEVKRQFPLERLLILEDTREIQCESENKTHHLATRTVSLTQLVRAALRSSPNRVILGEVRGPEALDLLDIWNTGHPGGACSLHANHAAAALNRLRSLVGRNREAPREIESLIAEAQPVVLHLTHDPQRGRVLREVLDVRSWEAGRYQVEPLS